MDYENIEHKVHGIAIQRWKTNGKDSGKDNFVIYLPHFCLLLLALIASLIKTPLLCTLNQFTI
jgi:hypothetical protein